MRDYDATLARIAGNVAVGLISIDANEFSPWHEQNVSERSVAIAESIIQRCQQRQREQVAAVAQRLSK